MPYIQIRTSCPVNYEQELNIKTVLGEKISLITDKIEKTLMLEIIDKCRLYLSGNNAPCAYISVLCNNTPEPDDLKKYSTLVINTISTVLEIDKNRIYVTHGGNPEWHTAGNLDL